MVIDLGERSAAPVHTGPGRPPFTAVRPVALVLVVLALLALGGSAAPLPRMRLVFTTGERIDAYALTPAALFTTEPGNAGFESAIIRRHDSRLLSSDNR